MGVAFQHKRKRVTTAKEYLALFSGSVRQQGQEKIYFDIERFVNIQKGKTINGEYYADTLFHRDYVISD